MKRGVVNEAWSPESFGPRLPLGGEAIRLRVTLPGREHKPRANSSNGNGGHDQDFQRVRQLFDIFSRIVNRFPRSIASQFPSSRANRFNLSLGIYALDLKLHAQVRRSARVPSRMGRRVSMVMDPPILGILPPVFRHPLSIRACHKRWTSPNRIGGPIPNHTSSPTSKMPSLTIPTRDLMKLSFHFRPTLLEPPC